MKTHKWIPVVLDFLLLAVLFWVVRYWHSLHFGLYEDDLTIIPDAFQRSFSSLMSLLYTYTITLAGHARPFSDGSIYLFSWLGWRIAGLWGPYLIGYFFTIINIGLFYWLMRRVYDRPIALIAGFGYVLFSANTTQAWLWSALGHQPALLLFLLAAHTYLSNKRIGAYVLAVPILFIYETPFLLLLAVPLLKKSWNKALIREIIWNTVVLLVILAAVYILRVFLGEGRAAGLGLKELFTTPIIHSIEGPLVSLGTYAYRPLQTLRSINIEIGLAILISFCIFLWVISHLNITSRVSFNRIWRSIKDPHARVGLPDEIKQLGRLFLTGLAFLIFAYPLTFLIRAYAISGRDTRVHFAAVVGSAIVVASFIFLFLYLSNGHRLFRIIVNVVTSLELALLVGYGFIIQHDYVLAWQYQKEFWTELVPLIPDASEGSVILVDPAALQDTSQIGANYWNLPRVLYQLYQFPSATKLPPGVNRLAEGWQNTLVVDGVFQVNSTTVFSATDDYGNYDSSKVIIIQEENDRLVRRFTINLGGIDYTLNPETKPILPALPHGFLYNMMINQP